MQCCARGSVGMQTPKFMKWLWSTVMAPISAKNLRMSALLIAVYQVLIGHVIFFIMLLGLAHAEQVKTMLEVDIADQVECEDYELVANTMNQMRLNQASELVSVTEVMLTVGTAIAFIYLVACLCLFAGVFRNKSQLILLWLIIDFIGIMFVLICVWTQNEKLIPFCGGTVQFFALCIGFMLFDFFIWCIVHTYYMNLRQMGKLTEVATVAIPCPPPGMIPFHFRKENMHLGSGGYKHVLTDCDPNLKV